MQKILIVEDLELQNRIYELTFQKFFNVLFATNHEEAVLLFNNNPDIKLIVMDGCLGGDTCNTAPLVQEFRKTFSGPVIAAPSSISHQIFLVQAGCDYQSEKGEVGELVKQILQRK